MSGKDDEQKALTALNAFTALANEMIIAAEPALCANLPNILQACGSKNGNIRTAADAAVQAICSKMSPNAVPGVSYVTSEVFYCNIFCVRTSKFNPNVCIEGSRPSLQSYGTRE